MIRFAPPRVRLVAGFAAIGLLASLMTVGVPAAATIPTARSSAFIGCATSTSNPLSGSRSCPTRVDSSNHPRYFTASSAPVVSGTARVGYSLSGRTAPWLPTPKTLTYQWLRNSEIILGATSQTYTLQPADLGTSVSLRVTGAYPNYLTTTLASRPVAVAAGVFDVVPTPRITGSADVNMTLSVNAGSWSPAPDLLSYQWNSNGVALSGETNSTYAVSPNDAGRRISVSVTATRVAFATHTITSASTAAVSVAIPIAKDGTYRVGVNLAPGTYVTTASTDDCYWERDSDFSGSFDATIANDIGSGERIATIEPSDVKFYASGCGRWERLQDAPSPEHTSFGTGVYAVGQQIEPGLYQASSGSECYWARRSGFSDFDGVEEVIANDFAGATTVEIESSDVGFETHDCGTWHRIGS